MITISSYWNLLFMLLLLNLGLNLDTGADQVSGMAIHSLKICALSLSLSFYEACSSCSSQTPYETRIPRTIMCSAFKSIHFFGDGLLLAVAHGQSDGVCYDDMCGL
ncbi:hypothetical protein P8452_03531 [Trifolium repens]|nr:hypothetical protein QL285_003761 [Trifolium repens]WJX13098.1 hypothetical protein P8452_03531 [Trifolium repens]